MRADSKGSDHHRNSFGDFPSQERLALCTPFTAARGRCLSRPCQDGDLSTFQRLQAAELAPQWLEEGRFHAVRACRCVEISMDLEVDATYR